jgi:hypothetical protein
MKCLVITSLLLLSFSSLAVRDERQLLKCLGEEEKKFHLKKETGPLYDLNQRLISEMIQIPNADFNPEDFAEICSRSTFSSSWKLLELSITRGNKIFHLPADVTGTQRSISQSMIDDYVEGSKEIFITFISQVQALAPSADCLKEEIPALANFFNDIKYLQEDVDIQKIFRGRDVKIFQKLKDYPQAFARCRERLKKKLKSESRPAAKKS